MSTILDTGPLVALLYRRERYHAWSSAQASKLPGPFYTCEAVLTEAHFLLRAVPQGTQRLLELLTRGRFDVTYSYSAHQARVDHLMQKYNDVLMSFADACIVSMAEELKESKILTLDADFRIYRKHRNRPLALIMP